MATNPELNSKEQAHTFGRYVVCSTLGEGAMGRVYLAQDPVLERKIALKVITVDNRLDNKTQAEYRNRFTVEAKASAKLDHQSIVAVYDAGDQDGLPWIAFQYIEGESLENLLKRKQKLGLNEAIKIVIDIASALQHAHSFKIYHRDIKPANIIIDKKSDIAKLTDFGIAKAPWIELTQDGKTLGTPGYMSPEQINGFELDACTDIFSLGVIFYKMVSGKHPFIRDTLSNTVYATLGGEYTPLSKLDPKLPVSLDSIITKCLAVNKEDRVQSADSFITLLKSTFKSNQEITQRVMMRSQKKTPGWNGKTAMQSKVQDGFGSIAAAVKSIKWSVLINYVVIILNTLWQYSYKSGITLYRGIVFSVKKLISFLKNMQKWNRRSKILYSLSIAIVFLIIASFWSVSLLRTGKPNTIVKTEKKKSQPKTGLLNVFLPKRVKECRAKIEEDNIEEAKKIANSMVNSKSKSIYGHILLGEIQINQGRYKKAKATFDQAIRLPHGKTTVKRELPTILVRIGKKLTRRKASQTLIDLTALTLHAAKNPVVKGWVKDQQYWLRWNAVYIMEASGASVDMVNVYILDLKYAGSSRTRVSAAKKLGEIGDKRAVPALEEAKNRGFRDPIVSLTASTVLEEHF